MNQDQAFLGSISETPDDDTPRLIYADWLEDNGRPERASFIRLQVEAARLPEGAARAALEAQAKQLLDEHGPSWLAGTGLPPEVVQFRRGFPHELDFTYWNEEPEGGWEGVVVPEEGFLAPMLTAARSWPELVCVRRLVLLSFDAGNGSEVVRVLADAPEYRRVTELVLMGQCLYPPDVEQLASSKTLTRLRLLSIQSVLNNQVDTVGDAGCAAIAGSPNFAHLEVLELGHTQIGDTGAVALAGSPYLANLRRLDLSWNKVGDAGALALAASRHLRSLTELIFEWNRASPDAVRALQARFGDLNDRE